MKKVIYTVKAGYNELADFDNLEQASKFFATLVSGISKNLVKVESKGKEAYYWKAGSEFTLTSEEVDVYPDEKEAKFAVFDGEASKE